MESRLEDGDSVILRRTYDISSCPLPIKQQSTQHKLLSTYISGYQARLTFNICNSVVFPALSRPKNRSFACLFISPRAERVSQTIARYSYQQDVPERALEGRFAKGSWGAAKTATYTS
jgi:hypothetical protein